MDGPFEKFPFVLEADYSVLSTLVCLLLLLLSHFSHVRLFATPYTSARQALLPLGFSTQEHWSGLPFPSPMHEREKVKVKLLSPVRLLATPWTAAYQAPPPMGFSRQEYWSGESRFASPQNQAGLLSNKTMQQKHMTPHQTMKQWWQETMQCPVSSVR